jgi:D-sedoheptulose 7-phosphate isomerase
LSSAMEKMIDKYPELNSCKESMEQSFRLMKKCYASGGKILLCGNGGSAADCEHIVGELMKGFMSKRPVKPEMRNKLSQFGDTDSEYLAQHLQGALPAISLVSHSALMTAYANDVAADMVFAQQVFGYGKPEDVLIGISTSGNSNNIVRAIQIAKAMGIGTIGLTGRTGGRMYDLCDVTIRVPWNSTPDVQERHLPIYHALCIMLEEEFFGS